MKLVSWNVNGIRAILTKGFKNFFTNIDADIFCIQETKMQEGQQKIILSGYKQYWNSAVKKGYSGTAIFIKDGLLPINVIKGIGIEEHDQEGRVITVEFESFYVINVYTPNSKRELERLAYRMVWEDKFREYILKLDKNKPIILCGDLNVAHKEIDLKNPLNNTHNAGFTMEERNKMSELLNSGFIDTFRFIYPNKKDMYTWWSYMHNSRQKDIGWRIDYFIISDTLKQNIKDVDIYSDVFGSDHCPVGLEINMEKNE